MLSPKEERKETNGKQNKQKNPNRIDRRQKNDRLTCISISSHMKYKWYKYSNHKSELVRL